MRHILYKSAPLFTLSVAMHLLGATAAEASPATKAVAPAERSSVSPDDIVRKMALNEIGGATTAPVVSIFRPNGDVVMPQAGQTQAQPQAVSACVTSSCAVGQPQKISARATAPAPIQNPSTAGTSPQNVLNVIASGIRNGATAPIGQVPSPIAQAATPLTTPLPLPSAAQPTPLVAQPVAVAAPTSFTESQPSPSQTAATSLDMGSFGRKLIAKSQSLMLSIRNDSSGLLSFGSTRLEIPAKLSSRLTLSTASLPTKLILNDLAWRPATEGQPSAMRLLLTDQASNVRSTVVLSLISAHRFANKPNV